MGFYIVLLNLSGIFISIECEVEYILISRYSVAQYQALNTHSNSLIWKCYLGTSLVAQWLGLRAHNAGGPGSIPGQGTIDPTCMP